MLGVDVFYNILSTGQTSFEKKSTSPAGYKARLCCIRNSALYEKQSGDSLQF